MRGIVDVKLKRLSALCVCFALCISVSLASPSDKSRFNELYDYYFPKDSQSAEAGYRKWFDNNIFDDNARPGLSKNDQMLFDAIRGNSKAYHQFVHSKYRGMNGEFGETWNYECLLLLLCLDDKRFANQLAMEDPQTKVLVGSAINSQVNWGKHAFPDTHNLIVKARGND